MINELKVTGKVSIVLLDSYGVEKDRREVNNTIVGTGLVHIAKRLLTGLDMPDPMQYMGLGTNGANPSTSDTGLLTEITGGNRTTCTVGQEGLLSKIKFVGTFDAGQYTKTTNPGIAEAGIFDIQQAGGAGSKMLCRVVFSPILKQAADTLSISWTITIS